MPVTLPEAQTIVRAYATRVGAATFSDEVVDRGSYWFFPVGYIGSVGVVVDKTDGRLFVMGSALKRDDMFWALEHGLAATREIHDEIVHEVLSEASEGKRRAAAQRALRSTLGGLAEEVKTPGTTLNYLSTNRF